MAILNRFMSGCFVTMCVGALAVTLAGCQGQSPASGSREQAPQAAMTPTTAPVSVKAPAAALPTIRVDAGASAPVTDAKGVHWSADTGFEGGSDMDRPDLNVTGTPTPEIYRTERYGMDSYSFKVPNGDYLVKLHFSEDYEGITSPDDRRFTYAVKDGTAKGKTIKEVKHFSPWQAAGAQYKAYVDTVPVTVTAGQITITFTPEVENPQINAIEIVPK
jgi:endoglucanase